MSATCRQCGNSFPLTDHFWRRGPYKSNKFNTNKCKLCCATSDDERRRIVDRALKNPFVAGAINAPKKR